MKQKLFTYEFISINMIAFFAFSNLAIFFNFNDYLKSIGIHGNEIGIIIGIFSLAALIFNPLFGYFLSPGKTHNSMLVAIIFIAICLLLYPLARTFWILTTLRFVHGLFFSLLLAAIVANFVTVIPPGRSGEAFGYFSLSNLLPYAVLPLILELKVVQHHIPNITTVYALSAAMQLPAAVLVVIVMAAGRKNGLAEAKTEKRHSRGILFMELRRVPVIILLSVNAIIFLVFSVLLYFLKDFANDLNGGNIGIFFTFQMIIMMAVRFFGGLFFDQANKVFLLVFSFGLMSMGFLCFNVSHVPATIYITAVLFGIGMGIGMPIINSVMHQVSTHSMVSFNLNCLVAMIQVGFILGPVLGAIIIANGGYNYLFSGCMALCLISTALSLLLLKDWGKIRA